MNGRYSITDYGAVGDGTTLDTAAIQAAIEAAAAGGGGIVEVPPGVYRTGTLFLRSRIELHLLPGSVLLGSPEREDYVDDDRYPENQPFTSENVSGAHLIVAYDVEQVAITGQGTIDGNSTAFMDGLRGNEALPYRYKVRPVSRDSIGWRPGQMLWFCRCRDVTLRDVRLLNAPYWSCLLLGCQDVRVRGLLIRTPPTTINGDGLDIDCSRRVTVSDCIIRTGDDCLTLRCNEGLLGDQPSPCEDIVVANCLLSSSCCAIRVGVGDGTVRRCRLSQLIISDTRTGICVVSRWSDRFRHGARLHDLDFSDLTLDCQIPCKIIYGHHAPALPPAQIANLRFDRLTILASGPAMLDGDPGRPLRNLSLRDIDWHRVQDDQAPSSHPFMIRAQHLADCRFERLRLTRDKAAESVTAGLVLAHCHDVKTTDLAPADEDAFQLCQRTGEPPPGHST